MPQQSAPFESEQAERGGGDIARDQRGAAQGGEHRGGEIGAHREQAAGRQRIAEHRNEERVHQRRQHGSADHELERQKSAEPQLPRQPRRMPHVHQPGLHPALEPAGALANPGAHARGRFLVRGRADHGRAEAETRQPHAKVGVLGDVVGVPSADIAQRLGAEMVR